MTSAQWVSYMLAADTRTGAAQAAPIDYAAEMTRLDTLWDASMMRARGAVAGFMAAQGSRIREQAPDDARAWANPRTWSMATRALAACIMHEAGHAVTFALLAGCIGEGNAVAFLGWYRKQDLPAATDVLAGRVALPLDTSRPDRTFAVLAECIAIMGPEHTARIWDLVYQARAVSFELLVMAVRAAAARRKALPDLFAPSNKGWTTIMRDPQLTQIVAAVPTT
jgi:hypothetical protein